MTPDLQESKGISCTLGHRARWDSWISWLCIVATSIWGYSNTISNNFLRQSCSQWPYLFIGIFYL